MPSFDVAHISKQGHTLIIVIVATPVKQPQAEALQACASCAGLSGTVVPVWKQAAGGFGFLCPPVFVPFMKSLTWELIVKNINRVMNCG